MLYLKKFSLSTVLIICLVMLLIGAVFPFIEGGGKYENRSEIWPSAFVAGLQSPLLGGGFGNIESVLPKGSESLKNNARFQYVDSSHNFLLDYWVQGGLVGFGIFIILLFKSVKNSLVYNNKLVLVLMLGVLTVMFFNPVSVVTLMHFWWLLGQGFKVEEKAVL